MKHLGRLNMRNYIYRNRKLPSPVAIAELANDPHEACQRFVHHRAEAIKALKEYYIFLLNPRKRTKNVEVEYVAAATVNQQIARAMKEDAAKFKIKIGG